MDRFLLLAPALLLLAIFCSTFLIYSVLCAVGRPPTLDNVKHNQFFGPFIAGFLVWLISPLERLLVGRVSPNAITAVSLLMCAVTGVVVALGHLALGVWLYVFAGILDVLDGRLARQSNQQTAAGALFDSVSDRWGELFVFAGYIWFLHDSRWLLAVTAAIGGSMMVSYTRARAEGLGINLAGGVMQRAERIVLVAGGTLIAAWYGTNPDTASIVYPIIGVTMLICGVASTATALNRWVLAYRELLKRSEMRIVHESHAPAVAPPAAPAPARVLISSRVHKVAAPVEQH